MSLHRLPALAALALIFCCPLHAEAPFNFATTPGKLPKNVVPDAYRVHLVPDLAAHVFTGEETIEITVKSAAREVVLNALELEIASATLTHADQPAETLRVKLDVEDQTLHLTPAQLLAPGRYQLAIRYKGVINAQAQGLYFDRYPTAHGEKQLIGTQMEPTDARRMLPCWDEPVFRASFQLSVDLPASLATYSNTPIVKTTPLAEGLQRTEFAPTPRMASYLVVLVAGELERIKSSQDGTEIGVVTTEGKGETAEYALDISKQLLHFYNDYFGVPYPLPKLDQLGTPGGFQGAMENWGGIVYNDNTLLFDPKRSSASTKEEVYGVVSHEMAHQWFGDLVTTAWWDNLWLNEGFASWMSTKAMDHFNPEWDTWLRANGERERAMALDARDTTHPIQQPVRNESEANDAFDDITYLKGQSFLRMLESWIGEDAFRTGIQAYMQRHAYSSTTTADLWAALGKASGKPVAKIAGAWTTQPGFPVIHVDAVCNKGQRSITLSQQLFTVDGQAGHHQRDARRWPVPIAILDTRASSAQYTLLSQRSQTVTQQGCEGPLVVDPDGVGYFRVEYSPALFEALRKRFASLPVATRLKLLSDTAALVAAQRQPLSAWFDLASTLGNEPKLALWQEVLSELGSLDSLSTGSPQQAVLRAAIRKLLTPRLRELGWDAKPGESFQDTQLRASLIEALGDAEDQDVIAEARRRFAAFLVEPSSLSSTIAEPVLATVGRHADVATYAALLKLAQAALTTEERGRYYSALASAEDPVLAAQTLKLALAPETPVVFANSLVPEVASDHLDLAWAFAKANGDALMANSTAFARNLYFGSVLRTASDAALADELEAYSKAHLPPEASTEVHRAADGIRVRARRRAALLPEFGKTFATHG